MKCNKIAPIREENIDAPKGKSRFRKALDVFHKVARKCWCPILVFVVLPLIALAVLTILKPQLSIGKGGVSNVGGSKDGEENSGGGSQKAGNFYLHTLSIITLVHHKCNVGMLKQFTGLTIQNSPFDFCKILINLGF